MDEQGDFLDDEKRDDFGKIKYLDNSSIVCHLKNPFKDNVLNDWKDELENKVEWEELRNKKNPTSGAAKRKVKWFSCCNCTYDYGSNIPPKPHKYINIIDKIEYFMIKALIKAYPGMFDWTKDNCTDCCHATKYDKNKDGCKTHSDDEPILDSKRNESCIFSFSFGNGLFTMSEKVTNSKLYTGKPFKCNLENGDILVMIGFCQRDYLHEAKNKKSARYNLTYRNNRLHKDECHCHHNGRSISKYPLGTLDVASRFDSEYWHVHNAHCTHGL